SLRPRHSRWAPAGFDTSLPERRPPGPREASSFSATWSSFERRDGLQAAFRTRPARMQAVQTRTCFRAPSTTALTRRKFGFHRRRRRLLAWLIVLPKLGFLPQISQTSAIVSPVHSVKWWRPSYQRLAAPESK